MGSPIALVRPINASLVLPGEQNLKVDTSNHLFAEPRLEPFKMGRGGAVVDDNQLASLALISLFPEKLFPAALDLFLFSIQEHHSPGGNMKGFYIQYLEGTWC